MSYPISGTCSITNTNIISGNSSLQYDVGPSGTPSGATVQVEHVAGRYIYATGVELSNVADKTTGVATFTKTIANKQGASVTHDDTTKLINGGYNYGDGTSGANDIHTYNPNGSYTATYTVANDLQNLSLSATSTVFAVPPTISISSSQSGRTFTITKTATDATSYIWYVNGSQYSTTSGNLTYTFSGYNPGSVTVYCKATGDGGSTNSNTLTLSVSGVSPSISVSISSYSGRTINLTSSASNTTSYQWQYSTDNTSWNNGGTATTYAYTVPNAYSGYVYFRCVATNSYTSVTSSTVTSKQFYALPTISISKTVSGRTVNLTSTTTGVSTYQWQYSTDSTSWTNGGTSSTYSYDTPTTYQGTMYFRCIVANVGGETATSNTESQVFYALPTISISGSYNAETRVYTLTPTYTYTTSAVWQESTDNVTWTQVSTTLGTITRTFDKKEEGTFYFRCIASGDGGSTTSNTVSIAVEKAVTYDVWNDLERLRRFLFGSRRRTNETS